jgi:hypothetical protein
VDDRGTLEKPALDKTTGIFHSSLYELLDGASLSTRPRLDFNS